MLTKPQFFYDHSTKQALGFQNPLYLKKAQQLEPKLYVSDIIEKTNAIVIPDSEETLMLAEESHSKMLLKQKDPIMLEKKVNITPVDYANYVNSAESTLSSRPTNVEVPKELPKVSMVNTSLNKLKHHLDGFDLVVKERTTPTAITEGSDLFNTFNQYLVDELSEVQNVFHQMEQAVEQHRLESKTFEVKMNQVLNENERLLEQVISKDIVNILVNSSVNIASVNVHECEKCLKLETELAKRGFRLKKEIYDKLFKSFTTLEKHCISLEVDSQLNQEIFQRDNSVSNQRVKPSTSASGSQPSEIQRNDKNSATPSSTRRIKVEAHTLGKFNISLKNKDCVVQPKGTAHVQHFKLNANSELKCVKCNILSDNHDLCVFDFINNMNAHKISKSVNKSSKRKVWKPTGKVVQIVLWYLDSGCSKHMTGDRSQLTNFVNKFLGTIKFGNDHVAKIMEYGDYQIGNVTISKVYYVEGLGHNLFSVWQFCYSNLEVAFRQHICFIRNLEGVDLLTGSRGNNMYTLRTLRILCGRPLLYVSYQRPQRLSHGYGTDGLAILNLTPTKKLYLLSWDLCGPMRIASVNGKKYILVIVDDYSRFTRVKFLRTDNGTEFVNQTLRDYYEKIGISHETYVARSPRQNGVVERHNRTLIEVARTMLIYAKAQLFLWAEAVATACYTQNRSIVRLHHDKTPYEILHDKPPDLSFFHVFGALCYPTNNSRRTWCKYTPKLDIDFDELNAMASEHSSSEPALHEMTPAIISSGLVPNPPPSTPFVPPSRTDWDILFQPLFDELLTPLPSVAHPSPKVIAPIAKVVAPIPAVSTGSPSSTNVDQDEPSPSNSQTAPET
ncbi:retrovirus-related pol polyprotein from transposon TNT 1-94 [Tanacetum coccineum]